MDTIFGLCIRDPCPIILIVLSLVNKIINNCYTKKIGCTRLHNPFCITTSHKSASSTNGCWLLRPIWKTINKKFTSSWDSVGTSVTRYDIWELVFKVYEKSLNPSNLRAAFKKTGIYPLSPNEIDIASTVPKENLFYKVNWTQFMIQMKIIMLMIMIQLKSGQMNKFFALSVGVTSLKLSQLLKSQEEILVRLWEVKP